MKKSRKISVFCLILVLAALCGLSISAGAVYHVVQKGKSTFPTYTYVGSTYTARCDRSSQVRYYVDDKNVATIGVASGKFKPKAPGEVRIIIKNAKNGKKLASKKVTVRQRMSSLAITNAEGSGKSYDVYLDLYNNKTFTPKLKKSPANTTDTLLFKPQNKSVVTISNSKITAVGTGEARILVYARKAKGVSADQKLVATIYFHVTDSTPPPPPDTRPEHTITFDPNGVDYPVETRTVKEGDIYRFDDQPWPQYPYRFRGWFYDQECTEANRCWFNLPVTSDLVVYGKWQFDEPRSTPLPPDVTPTPTPDPATPTDQPTDQPPYVPVEEQP